MQELSAQIRNKTIVPFSPEDQERLAEFQENQIVTVRVSGVKKHRSIQQNKWIHAIFRIVAMNTDDPEWNTPEKVKRNVKMAMRFFKDDVIVHNNKVYFELRSFAFDRMEQNEANMVYNHAKEICAEKINISPAELEAAAMKE